MFLQKDLDRLALKHGAQVQYHQSVTSTNDLALAWLETNAPKGSLVIAEYQTRGRGRLNRHWQGETGASLMLTYLCYPQVDQLHQISMMGALSVVDALTHMGAVDVKIKYPNDIYVQGRKICGILPENAWRGDQLLGVVIGIGINIDVPFADPEVIQKAINLKTVLGQPVDRTLLLDSLWGALNYWARELGSQSLFERWRSQLMTLGQTVRIQNQERWIEGQAEAVDEAGYLYIRTGDGTLEKVIAGDILLL